MEEMLEEKLMVLYFSRRKRLAISQGAEWKRPCNPRRGAGGRKVERSPRSGAGDWCSVDHKQLGELGEPKGHSLSTSEQT